MLDFFLFLLIYGSSIHETDDDYDDDEMRALFILCKIIEMIPLLIAAAA